MKEWFETLEKYPEIMEEIHKKMISTNILKDQPSSVEGKGIILKPALEASSSQKTLSKLQ